MWVTSLSPRTSGILPDKDTGPLFFKHLGVEHDGNPPVFLVMFKGDMEQTLFLMRGVVLRYFNFKPFGEVSLWSLWSWFPARIPGTLKLTASLHLKIDGWKLEDYFPCGKSYFQVQY